MQEALHNFNDTISINGREIKKLRFADDSDPIAGTEELQKLTTTLEEEKPNDNWADVDVAQIIGHSLRGLVRLFVLLRHALRKDVGRGGQVDSRIAPDVSRVIVGNVGNPTMTRPSGDDRSNGDNVDRQNVQHYMNALGVFSWTMKSLLFLQLLASVSKIHADLPDCKSTDFHYEYTECDSNGGRWRVAVPAPETCKGGQPPPAVRGKSCGFTCQPGGYLDIDSETQDCKPCPAGTYSLGGGALYDNWDHFPKGFSASVETFHMTRYFGQNLSNQSCASAKWKATGKFLSSMAGDCTAILMYTANLIKAGYVTFEYQFTDESSIFEFIVQNDKCHNVKYDDDVHWPPKTRDGKWGTAKMNLKPGRNLIYWKTLSLQLEGRLQTQTLIRKIEVKGVAYTSECSKCRPGTYSNVGMTECNECPRNTHSQRGASQCIKCDNKTEYSS
ncbi:hypothetical protein LSAT2_023110 [Lamellibrachia satsuma]|nr:hypothetical protein LSAT2_023110 [Lamellibrachia satsuma]